jgi:hypothetical protein
MMQNPFRTQSRLNLPLQPELCQRMHFTALQKVARRAVSDDRLPEHMDSTHLSTQKQRYGAEVCLIHPADIDRIFAGVSLDVYRTVEQLYCSRETRSIAMVWSIMQRMAAHADVTPIAYEAIWSICVFLDERRTEETSVVIEPLETPWWVVQFQPDIRLHSPNGGSYTPLVMCILDGDGQRVLAFRVQQDPNFAGELALYDAIVAHRQPAPRITTGLVWQFPTHMLLGDDMPLALQQSIEALGLPIQHTAAIPPILEHLRGTWMKDIANKPLLQREFTRLLNTYLRRLHGYGPRTEHKEHQRDYAHLMGYNRDPAWQFPALRRLLPAQSGIIAEDGSVEYNGLHLEHDLLTYWGGHHVTVRRSLQSDAAAYIYIDNDILCLAMARELRRRDGSHRTKRTGRR